MIEPVALPESTPTMAAWEPDTMTHRFPPRTPLDVTIAIATFVFSGLVDPSFATALTRHVGPGQPFAAIGDIAWESLAPGDSVLIHARPAPYAEKWVLCRVGTQALPIVVKGIPDGSGNLPVITGLNATTRPQLNFWSENRGIIKIGGANTPPDVMPAWIVVENLDLTSAHTPNTFTGRNGVTAWAGNAAGIYIEKGQHIVVRGCRFRDCGNGFFSAYQSSDVLVEGCRYDDNGNASSIFEHNNYTETFGITFQYNWFGPLKIGAGGNNLKDRSAGCVIRYNWIEGGNRQLDLVDSDYPELYDDPSYRNTFVYGNVMIERDADGNSQVAHYGGDSGSTSHYRQGTLWFFHNTVVSRRAGNTTLFRLSSAGETADARNNIVLVTATGNRLAMLDLAGTLTITQNWFKTGWVNSHSGAANVINNGQITGSDPGFRNVAADSFELKATSPCLDQASAAAPATLPGHAVVREYVRHQSSRARPTNGARDLGAYEYATVSAVPDGGVRSIARLLAANSPSRGPFQFRLADAPATRAPIEIFDVQGRLVARAEKKDADGPWVWEPSVVQAPGMYFARVGAFTARVVLVR